MNEPAILFSRRRLRQRVDNPSRYIPRLRATVTSIVALSLSCVSISATGATVSGSSVTYRSPNGVVEKCARLDRMPGGVYTDEDIAQERAFCGIDFYAGSHALCPKVKRRWTAQWPALSS